MKLKLRYVCMLFVLLLFSFATTLFAQVQSEVLANTTLQAQINTLFAEWDKTDSPDCALAIMKNGKIVYALYIIK